MSNKISPGIATVIIVIVVLVVGLIIWKFSTKGGHPPTAAEWQQITAKAGAVESQQNTTKGAAPAQSTAKPAAPKPATAPKGR